MRFGCLQIALHSYGLIVDFLVCKFSRTIDQIAKRLVTHSKRNIVDPLPAVLHRGQVGQVEHFVPLRTVSAKHVEMANLHLLGAGHESNEAHTTGQQVHDYAGKKGANQKEKALHQGLVSTC